ncbi:MAG: hypothetical protein KKH92_00390 [Firmicutes bacterium]|nr:hypothetical protein [Bacillota bacterium]
MSVIVGIIHKGVVYIGSDSQLTKGGTKKNYNHPNNRKIWHPDGREHLLMGSSGVLKGINTIKSINGIIDQKTLSENTLNYSFVVRNVARKIMESMEEVKLIDSKDYNPKMLNEFLFANNDELFMIGSDGSVLQIDDFTAIGSGAIESIGSLLSTESEEPRTRIIKAIEAAIQNDIYVGYPIVIMSTKNQSAEIIQGKE